MKKLLFMCGVFLLLLAACGSNDGFKEDSAKTKSNAEQTKSKKSKKEQKLEKEVAKLSEKQKLALAFCVEDVDRYTLTKNEILTGIYEYKLATGNKNFKLVDFKLVKYDDSIKNAPKGMNFYNVSPNKGNFEALIGVSNDKIFIGRMQSGSLDYKDLLGKGKEVKLIDVYKANKDNKALPELTDKINIVDSLSKKDKENNNPLSAEYLEKSGTVNTHFRNQVYQMISDFEGIAVGKTNYLWDDVKMVGHSGDWIVNYRNKDGEILGTYKTKNNKIIKLDANGKVIKQEN